MIHPADLQILRPGGIAGFGRGFNAISFGFANFGRWPRESFPEDTAIERFGWFNAEQPKNRGGKIGVAGGISIDESAFEIRADADQSVVHIKVTEAGVAAENSPGAGAAAIERQQSRHAEIALAT